MERDPIRRIQRGSAGSCRAGPGYGIDGWPYVLGLGATTVLAAGAAVVIKGKVRWALLGVAAAAGVPEVLGLRYVFGGKLRHRERLLDRVDWRGDEVVLDAGAGAGLMGIGAARRAPRGRVDCVDLWVGKDLAGSGPDRLRRNAAEEGVADRVEVHTGDARALDFEDASVDVVLSVLCLHNIPDVEGRAAAARELTRVLRPGGSIVVGDLAGTDDLARWFTEQGLVVVAHERAPGTFPPQRLLHARRPI